MAEHKQKYNSQKNSAKRRGIDWQFTFESWLNWWGDDIINRGKYKGQLVMARYGDQGPYHPNNVYKATTKENQNDSHLGKLAWNRGIPHSNEHKEKIRLAGLGRIHTAESKKLMGINKIGKPRSEEVKQKIRETLLRKNQNV